MTPNSSFQEVSGGGFKGGSSVTPETSKLARSADKGSLIAGRPDKVTRAFFRDGINVLISTLPSTSTSNCLQGGAPLASLLTFLVSSCTWLLRVSCLLPTVVTVLTAPPRSF